MIEVSNLFHRYMDGTPALRGISLRIPDGEFVLICGSNGSGKTTLLRHLNGLLKPSSGTVFIDEIDVSRNEREAMRRVGMVFQDADSQIVGETVKEDAAFGPENLGLSTTDVQECVNRALTMTGLDTMADKPCHLLSGGEKRRLAIAGVLAMEPRILLLDEPFANLDFRGVRQVLLQIAALHHKGHTIVMTSHDVEKVADIVDRIAVLHEGELVAIGPPREIIPHLPAYNVRRPCWAILGKEMMPWLAE